MAPTPSGSGRDTVCNPRELYRYELRISNLAATLNEHQESIAYSTDGSTPSLELPIDILDDITQYIRSIKFFEDAHAAFVNANPELHGDDDNSMLIADATSKDPTQAAGGKTFPVGLTHTMMTDLADTLRAHGHVEQPRDVMVSRIRYARVCNSLPLEEYFTPMPFEMMVNGVMHLTVLDAETDNSRDVDIFQMSPFVSLRVLTLETTKRLRLDSVGSAVFRKVQVIVAKNVVQLSDLLLAPVAAAFEPGMTLSNTMRFLTPSDSWMKLTSLTLSDSTHLTELDSTLTLAAHLRTLVVDHCPNLTELPDLSTLSSLKKLTVTHCAIKSLAPLWVSQKPPRSISELDLSHNQLPSLTDFSASYFPALRFLDFTDNKIARLDDIAAIASSTLQVLNLDMNPVINLEDLDLEIVRALATKRVSGEISVDSMAIQWDEAFLVEHGIPLPEEEEDESVLSDSDDEGPVPQPTLATGDADEQEIEIDGVVMLDVPSLAPVARSMQPCFTADLTGIPMGPVPTLDRPAKGKKAKDAAASVPGPPTSAPAVHPDAFLFRGLPDIQIECEGSYDVQETYDGSTEVGSTSMTIPAHTPALVQQGFAFAKSVITQYMSVKHMGEDAVGAVLFDHVTGYFAKFPQTVTPKPIVAHKVPKVKLTAPTKLGATNAVDAFIVNKLAWAQGIDPSTMIRAAEEVAVETFVTLQDLLEDEAEQTATHEVDAPTMTGSADSGLMAAADASFSGGVLETSAAVDSVQVSTIPSLTSLEPTPMAESHVVGTVPLDVDEEQTAVIRGSEPVFGPDEFDESDESEVEPMFEQFAEPDQPAAPVSPEQEALAEPTVQAAAEEAGDKSGLSPEPEDKRPSELRDYDFNGTRSKLAALLEGQASAAPPAPRPRPVLIVPDPEPRDSLELDVRDGLDDLVARIEDAVVFAHRPWQCQVFGLQDLTVEELKEATRPLKLVDLELSADHTGVLRLQHGVDLVLETHVSGIAHFIHIQEHAGFFIKALVIKSGADFVPMIFAVAEDSIDDIEAFMLNAIIVNRRHALAALKAEQLFWSVCSFCAFPFMAVAGISHCPECHMEDAVQIPLDDNNTAESIDAIKTIPEKLSDDILEDIHYTLSPAYLTHVAFKTVRVRKSMYDQMIAELEEVAASGRATVVQL
ncbi:Leucine-rich repeat [Carpediemonas membranifera]|uniref:Leucine-rich repeat n=1 Tax=Carpediemonas membranifera TaxID=201153 RepID=A0A8J6B860_9EUKA|nr:Leucine-rich repeat [Carpediemonas membranifera]|eukprot:KAG9395144.1 Leucine-rich repeat [Carpediemonas membranifera]